jgi:pyruvate formate lyase activating enzyme
MHQYSKRRFLKQAGISLTGLSLARYNAFAGFPELFKDQKLWKWCKECMFYETTPRGLKCLICPNECILAEGDESFCRNRVNYHNKLYSIAYGNPCAMNIDPVEKKPFYHFLPGSRAFSIATAGCNFACLNCQNWTISQTSPKKTKNADLMPPLVADQAKAGNCRSIAYTYSEPVTFYEYVYDTSLVSRTQGIKNILVSNGFINEKPLRHLCKVIDAATIDLKSFDDNTYVRLNAGSLKPVLNSLKIYKEEGVWLEISNLVVPQWSDNPDMIKKMCDWLYDNGFDQTPLHFLRFQPMYKLTQLPPTPVAVIQKSAEIARQAGIKYVYTGNVPGSEEANTKCPRCKKTVIERRGYTILSNHIKKGSCEYCGEKIAGKWE